MFKEGQHKVHCESTLLTEKKYNLKQVQSRFPMCQKVHDLDACYSYKKMKLETEGSF